MHRILQMGRVQMSPSLIQDLLTFDKHCALSVPYRGKSHYITRHVYVSIIIASELHGYYNTMYHGRIILKCHE